jgi:glycosyltransferase involved in cell wall biosynthesis
MMTDTPLKPKLILMTADTVGGVWTYALELARALAPHGIKVRLASFGARPSDEQRAEAEAVSNLRLFESSHKLEWMESPWQDVSAAGEWLLDLERMLEPDVIHLNGYAHGALNWRAPALVVAHSCVLSWWKAVKREAAPASWDRYRLEVTRGLQSAGMVIAPTRAMLDAAMEHYGPLPKTTVIPNGRDSSLFNRSHKESFIFAAGRLWDEAKNIASLERVAPRLTWPVYVAGERKRADRGTARSTVRTLGQISNSAVAGWLGKASIYALPARYEPFGLSVLEAALSECALVVGDIESLRENWTDAAMFVPPDDPHALKDALEQLIRDATLRKAFAERARFRALELTPDRMAAGYLSAYAELMATRKQAQTSIKEMAHCGS